MGDEYARIGSYGQSRYSVQAESASLRNQPDMFLLLPIPACARVMLGVFRNSIFSVVLKGSDCARYFLVLVSIPVRNFLVGVGQDGSFAATHQNMDGGSPSSIRGEPLTLSHVSLWIRERFSSSRLNDPCHSSHFYGRHHSTALSATVLGAADVHRDTAAAGHRVEGTRGTAVSATCLRRWDPKCRLARRCCPAKTNRPERQRILHLRHLRTGSVTVKLCGVSTTFRSGL